MENVVIPKLDILDLDKQWRAIR